MEIRDLVQTCGACPSQWEARTIENRPVYVRYRWGYLSVRVGEPDESVDGAVGGYEVYGEQVGDGYDGSIYWSDVIKRIENLDVLKVIQEVKFANEFNEDENGE